MLRTYQTRSKNSCSASRISARVRGSSSLIRDSASPCASRYSSPLDITEFAGNAASLLSVGDNGPALDSAYFGSAAVAADADGNVYIADEHNNRVQEIAVSTHTQFGMTPAEQACLAYRRGPPGRQGRPAPGPDLKRSWRSPACSAADRLPGKPADYLMVSWSSDATIWVAVFSSGSSCLINSTRSAVSGSAIRLSIVASNCSSSPR